MEVWGWLIAIYLFLGGVGAGAYLTSLAADQGFFGYTPGLKRFGFIISAPIVGIGAGLLVLDLGQGLHKPWLLIGLLSNPHSVMSWGTGILSVFICLGLARGYLAWRKKRSPKVLDYAGGVFALATAVYTGMLLVAVKAIPFWHNYLVPVLFLISALSTGMSATTVLTHFVEKEPSDHKRVCLSHLVLVASELAVLFILFTLILSGIMGPVAARSGSMLVFDNFAAVFWLLLVGVGLVGPLILYISTHRHPGRQLKFFRVHQGQENHRPTLNCSENLGLILANGLQRRERILKLPGGLRVIWCSMSKLGTPKQILVCDLAVLIGGLALRCLFIFAALPVWNGLLT